MTGSTDDRLRTGGAFDALPNYEEELESKLRGRVLSGYKVGRVIGSGGMGYVLHATRAEGDFEREAAIKVVVATHNTSELARRFRMEVQILAKLNHPSIAQLYDAGETEEGWPYLVMEYVDGSPVDGYCVDNDLRTGDRLDLRTIRIQEILPREEYFPYWKTLARVHCQRRAPFRESGRRNVLFGVIVTFRKRPRAASHFQYSTR